LPLLLIESAPKTVVISKPAPVKDDRFVAISKREMAEYLGKCEKTIDRAVSDLRKRGLVETSSRYGAGGGQIANAYRVTSVAKEKYPALVS